MDSLQSSCSHHVWRIPSIYPHWHCCGYRAYVSLWCSILFFNLHTPIDLSCQLNHHNLWTINYEGSCCLATFEARWGCGFLKIRGLLRITPRQTSEGSIWKLLSKIRIVVTLRIFRLERESVSLLTNKYIVQPRPSHSNALCKIWEYKCFILWRGINIIFNYNYLNY